MSSKPPAELGSEHFRRIADSIGRVSDMGKALRDSGLTQRAVLLLLQDLTGVPRGDIQLILNALPQLRTYFLTKVTS